VSNLLAFDEALAELRAHLGREKEARKMGLRIT